MMLWMNAWGWWEEWSNTNSSLYCPVHPPTYFNTMLQTLKYYTTCNSPFLYSAHPGVILSWSVLPAGPQFVLCAWRGVCVGVRCRPAGQQGWARCGVGAVGRLGTVGLLIRERWLMGQQRRSTELGRRDEGRWGGWGEEAGGGGGVNCLGKGAICDHLKTTNKLRTVKKVHA